MSRHLYLVLIRFLWKIHSSFRLPYCFLELGLINLNGLSDYNDDISLQSGAQVCQLALSDRPGPTLTGIQFHSSFLSKFVFVLRILSSPPLDCLAPMLVLRLVLNQR